MPLTTQDIFGSRSSLPPEEQAQANLLAQILGQGTTSKWRGGFGAQDAAKDMAKILAGIGITDISQFGKVPVYRNVTPVGELYQGQLVRTAYDDNNQFAYKYITETIGWDSENNQPIGRQIPIPQGTKLDTAYGESTDDPYGQPTVLGSSKDVTIKDGQTVVATGQTVFGNKVTGQAVPITYGERQRDPSTWGGTFQGSGNTGYRVDFTPDGKPVFYTTGASSSDSGDWMPLLAVASLGLGAPLLGEVFGAGAGAVEGLSALDAGMGVYGSGAGAGAGLLGGAEGLSALDAGMGAYPTTGEIGLSGLDAGMGAYPSTGTIEPSALDAGMGAYPSTGTIGAEAATPSIVDKVKDAASKLSVSDALRAAGLVASVAGAGKLASNLGSSGSGGSGGYDIVPIPSDWTSPIKPTGVAEFTPLAPIDFGNKEMLKGTQWEKLLSPTYGQTPPMPSAPVNPSNMSYDELTKILGGSRTSVPTQNLSINDVIAGIQNQYGQAPSSAMGQKPA
jgi:hypothetical protein